MPELKRHFRAGRMNKDLDERLVPDGEYRNAENIEIATSEGSDVGAAQNVVGNTKLNGKTYNASSQTVTANWTSNTISGLNQPKCIGSIKDTQNDKIYWFIAAGTTADDDILSAIVEYNETTNVLAPVLVDKNEILNFSQDYPITGVNIIEGMLLWTDNQTEPKKLKISTFKSGSTDFNTHTTFNGAAFTENDITVAKLSPLQAPTLTMAASKRTGNGTGTTEAFSSKKFTDGNGDPLAHQSSVTITLTPSCNFRKDDIISLTHEDEEGLNYEVKLLITKLNNVSTANLVSSVNAKIQSIPTNVPNKEIQWSVLLDEEQPMFEKKFVRFGYRWKYKDGEYSVFSPFSLPAFLPTDFEYKSTNGYNLGMINTLRSLTVNLPDTQPSDVDEVDILYKESTNNLVYVVDTLKNNETSYEIQSEIIGSVVESNQILRPWDNVPKRALAQEITANRLIYGNYYQQYDILKQNMPDIETAVVSSKITSAKTPEKSLKSQRTYQVGLVYRDAYGRETPVFSNKKAAKSIAKKSAHLVNNLECTLANDPPDWATHYKFFVKETSNEYYNVALDRFYLADDGNVWLSFPSSERNKIQEDSYLILKKQHDDDDYVSTEARYKVLDIQSEAPKSIKMISKSIATSKLEILDSAVNAPQVGATSFQLKGPEYTKNAKFADGLGADGVITMTTSGGTTGRYKIATGGINGEVNGTGAVVTDNKYVYDFSLVEPIKDIDSTIFGSSYIDADSFITIKLYEEKEVEKAEFYGRFFVKINRDSTFDTNIIETFPALETEYTIKYSRDILADAVNDFSTDVSDDGKTKKRARQDLCWTDTKAMDRGENTDWRFMTNKHPVSGQKTLTIIWAGINYGEAWKDNENSDKGRKHNELDSVNPFLESLNSSGTLIQFADANGNTGSVYEIEDATINYAFRRKDQNERSFIGGKRREYNLTIKNADNGKPYDDTFSFSGTKIAKINIMERAIPLGNDVLSSENPCIFETEPKESVELDLYYEISDAYPIIKAGMSVSGTGIAASTTIASITDANNFTLSQNSNAAVTNGTITLTDAKGIYSFTATATFSNSSTAVTISDGNFHGHPQTLDWFNCYSFGNGVESDRLRDDFNAPRIDKGVKVSMPLAEQYKEEHKQNGLIFSGIFNSTSGLNRLNQFIQAEPITKDLNPYYGSIQKILGRDTDLITLCEDKVLRILANKDALFNADGDTNVTSTNRVLGSATPFAGEYGISKDPESLVSYANSIYFSDKARGVICSLQGGSVVPISDAGMKDWFKDNLASATSVLGTYNQAKNEYNVTLKGTTDYTVSYNERTQGWTSFKSYIPESGCSLNNNYYTFKNGEIYVHNNATRNNFYGTQYQSSIKVLLNDMPETIKGFKTVNYEGTDARKYTYSGTISGTKIASKTIDQLVGDGYTGAQISGLTQDTLGAGWYCSSITTNEATGSIRDFKNKEGKWFNYVKGDATTLSNLDSEEFSVQGIGNMSAITGDTSVTGYDVVVTITGETGISFSNPRSYKAASDEAGDETWVQNGNVFTVYDVANGTNLNTFDELLIDVAPTTGYTLPSTNVIASQSPTSFEQIDSGQSDWSVCDTDGLGSLTLDFVSQTISGADKTITIDLQNAGVGQNYSVAGTYDVVSENVDIKSSVNNSYTKSAAYLTDSAIDFGTPDNIAFTADSGYYFASTPTCEVITEDSDTESYYTISTANTTTDSDGNVTKVTFTINYKHGAANVTGDKLLFTAKAKKIFVTPTGQITGFKTNKDNLLRRGDTRKIIVIGEPGVTFKVSRLKSNPYDVCWLDDGDDSPWSDTAKRYWDGDSWELTATELTIPSSGSYVIDDTISSSSTSRRYTWKVEDATISMTDDNPIVLYQYTDVTFTMQLFTDGNYIAPGGTGEYGTLTSSYPSLTRPPEESSYRYIPIEFYIYRNTSNDEDDDYLTSTPPSTEYIRYHEVSSKPASSSFGTTQLTMPSIIQAIQERMIVTGGDVAVRSTTNEPNGVTVTDVHAEDGSESATITLSSNQALSADDTLTFSPPDDWEFQVTNLAIAAAADTTATGSGSAGTAMTISEANSAIKKGMRVTGTNMHDNAVVTNISGTTVTLSDAASGTMSGTYNFLGDDGDPTTGVFVYKVTGNLEIQRYGSVDITTTLHINSFVAQGGGSGTGGGLTAFITIQPGSNLTEATMTRHSITEGTAHNATFNGTMTLTGNWDGNTASDVQSGLEAAGLTSKSQIQGITYTSSLTFTGGGYSGTGSSATASGESTTAEINYQITIDNASGGNATSTDIATGYDFTVNVTGGTFQDP